MSEPRTIGIGVIGLGFMGCTHIRAYQAIGASGAPGAPACKLMAVADKSAERLAGRAFVQGNIDTGGGEQLFDPRTVRCYLDPTELVRDPRVDAVSICTHTDTHVDLAVAALRAGKHVLVEKPVALSSAEARRLAQVAMESGKVCMPGMVMRFWPEWVWLRDAIRAGTYGKVLSASFTRMGETPLWTDFYRDVRRSGGALFDLHIHDSDFIRWCFGMPQEVVVAGSTMHLTTLYRFGPDGPAHVRAEGAQDCSVGFPFRIRYTIVFERATADYDFTRTPTLLVYSSGRAETPTIATPPGALPYDIEVRAFLGALASGKSNPDLAASIDDAATTLVLLEAEQRSLLTKTSQRTA